MTFLLARDSLVLAVVLILTFWYSNAVGFDLAAEEKALLENIGVEALILFGSRAQGLEGPASDFDFGALLSKQGFARRDEGGDEEGKNVYNALYDLLSSHIKKLVNIDIVFLENAPMELQSHVVKYGVPIYEKTQSSFSDFREKIIERYADFAPLRFLFHRAIISRIYP